MKRAGKPALFFTEDRKMLPKDLIAKFAHQINRAYCRAIGDDSQPEWESAPKWQKDSAIAGVEMHQRNPDATPEDSHNSWLEQKLAEGWTWGETKDVEAKQHPCVTEYENLPVSQKVKDYLFKAVVDLCSAIELPASNVKAGTAPVGTIAIRYIGKKDNFSDRLYGTELPFEKGQVRNIPTAIARKMLKHQDVYEQAEAAPIIDDDTAEILAGVEEEANKLQDERELVADVLMQLGRMDEQGLRQYAETKYGQKLSARMKQETLLARVTEMVEMFGVV